MYCIITYIINGITKTETVCINEELSDFKGYVYNMKGNIVNTEYCNGEY